MYIYVLNWDDDNAAAAADGGGGGDDDDDDDGEMVGDEEATQDFKTQTEASFALTMS